MANCNVTITVKNGDANVSKYACDTRQGGYVLKPIIRQNIFAPCYGLVKVLKIFLWKINDG